MAGAATDDDAAFDRDETIDAAEIAPVVTWGTSPEDALPITATVPDPSRLPKGRAEKVRGALDYMGLTPGGHWRARPSIRCSSAHAPTHGWKICVPPLR